MQRARIDGDYKQDRVRAADLAQRKAAAEAAARPGADERPAAALCRVLGDDEGSDGPYPGVMTAWRRLPFGGWSARVTYAIPRPGEDTLLAQQWLPDTQLRGV
ncbi:hypothetical protein GCM10027519_42350 [Kineococcus endophyticus]